MTDKWEYEIMPFPEPFKGLEFAKESLNKMGLEGWEIINIIYYPEFNKFVSDGKSPLFAFLKRQKKS